MKLRQLAVVLGLVVALTGCTSNEPATTTPETGTTTEKTEGTESFTGTVTRETLYSATKGDVVVVEMTFEAGTPTDLTVDVRTESGDMKSELAAAGDYNMGEGSTPWNEQADTLVAFIKDNNFDLSKVTYTNEAGNTDAVSGVSIKVSAYIDAIQALMDEVAAGEVATGFTGARVGEAAEEGGTTTATVMFEHGTPVNVKFDYIMADGQSKYQEAKLGNYDMGAGSTPWNEQADTLAAFLVQNNFDATTDAVTGVSIALPGFIAALENALQ